MNPKSGSIVKALIARFHPRGENDLIRFLPSHEKAELDSLSTSIEMNFSHLISVDAWMQPIHYSWFFPVLSSFPPKTQALLLSIFPKKQAIELQKMLKLPSRKTSSPSFIAAFLSHFLKEKVLDKKIIPEDRLPSSEMNLLLTLSKPETIHMIDLLGIYDLAFTLKQTIDRNLIGKIYAALSEEQLHFLHYCLKQPVKWAPPKMNLLGWEGDSKLLTNLLHQRGLIRFAKAISDENSSLKWHICHRLDSGRGKAIIKLLSVKYDPDIVPYFKGQVLHLVKRYKK